MTTTRRRAAAIAIVAVFAVTLSSCSSGPGSYTLYGTITIDQTSCAGSLRNATIQVSGTSQIVGSGRPTSVTGTTCNEKAQYAIQVRKSTSYAVSLTLSAASTIGFGPFTLSVLQQHNFRLDIMLTNRKSTTSLDTAR